MRVLVGCEYSGKVRDEFRKRGHDAWSCDLLPSDTPGKHIQGDLLAVLDDDWDLGIFFPPCTYLSYAANHVWDTPGRAEKRIEAASFFMKLVHAPIAKISIENPVGMMNTIYRKPDQMIEPFYFGDTDRKRTCLWLKNLPQLRYAMKDTMFEMATAVAPPQPIYRRRSDGKAIHFAEAKHGGHVRSKTFSGIAKAMAEQWG